MSVRSASQGVLYADDSGGEADALRSLAVLSGPASVLLSLERDLRKVLQVYGLKELKWASLRTRPARLLAAESALELLAVALGAKALRCDILLWRPAQQGLAYRQRSEPQRLRPLYAQAWLGAARAWRFKAWRAYPDQRTGMDWQHWSPAQRRAWRKAGLGSPRIREADSRASTCIQVADLLAGLARLQARKDAAEPGARAHANRLALLDHWRRACAPRGLTLGAQQGLLHAQHPQLHIRLLKRLPTRA